MRGWRGRGRDVWPRTLAPCGYDGCLPRSSTNLKIGGRRGAVSHYSTRTTNPRRETVDARKLQTGNVPGTTQPFNSLMLNEPLDGFRYRPFYVRLAKQMTFLFGCTYLEARAAPILRMRNVSVGSMLPVGQSNICLRNGEKITAASIHPSIFHRSIYRSLHLSFHLSSTTTT